MKILSKFIWLPVIRKLPVTEPHYKCLKLISLILYLLNVAAIFVYLSSQYYSVLPTQFPYLIFCFFYLVWLHIENYFSYHVNMRKDLSFRRFIGFNATLQEVIAIRNPTTDYHYQIKIQTDEPIPQDQQQEWLITPNLYPIHLRALVGHEIYIESLANSPLIFNLKPYLLNQNQQEIFFTHYHLEYPKANGQYKKCRYNSIQKVELDTSQLGIQLSIGIKDQNIQITLNDAQLKLMETIFFSKFFMFSQRQYLAIKNQKKYGIIWQS